MRRLLKNIFLILLISIVLISSIFLYKNYKEESEQEKIFESLSNIIKDEIKDGNENNINFDELYEINNDIIGWLKIEDTGINYPIMQTKDRPNYYLRRNFYGDYSILRYTIYCRKL